jgi:hypothetical protein
MTTSFNINMDSVSRFTLGRDAGIRQNTPNLHPNTESPPDFFVPNIRLRPVSYSIADGNGYAHSDRTIQEYQDILDEEIIEWEHRDLWRKKRRQFREMFSNIVTLTDEYEEMHPMDESQDEKFRSQCAYCGNLREAIETDIHTYVNKCRHVGSMFIALHLLVEICISFFDVPNPDPTTDIYISNMRLISTQIDRVSC